jgi:hypothetical protein
MAGLTGWGGCGAVRRLIVTVAVVDIDRDAQLSCHLLAGLLLLLDGELLLLLLLLSQAASSSRWV